MPEQYRNWTQAKVNCEKIIEDIQLSLPDFIADDLFYIVPLPKLLTNNEWYVFNKLIKGWTYRQITAEVDVCKMTVSKIYRRAVKKIINTLKQEGVCGGIYKKRFYEYRPAYSDNQSNAGK